MRRHAYPYVGTVRTGVDHVNRLSTFLCIQLAIVVNIKLTVCTYHESTYSFFGFLKVCFFIRRAKQNLSAETGRLRIDNRYVFCLRMIAEREYYNDFRFFPITMHATAEAVQSARSSIGFVLSPVSGGLSLP